MKNLHQKINDIQKEVKSVFKGSKVSITQNSSYQAVSHDDVAALLHLPMADAGIAVEVSMDSCEISTIVTKKEYQGKVEDKISYMAKVCMLVTFVNSDEPCEDRYTVKSFAYAFDSGDKAVGKACSMAVKYVYLKNFNLESTDEEESRDNERDQQTKHEPQKQPPAQQSMSVHQNGVTPVSEQQRKAIWAISKKNNIEAPKLSSFEEAKEWITRMNKGN